MIRLTARNFSAVLKPLLSIAALPSSRITMSTEVPPGKIKTSIYLQFTKYRLIYHIFDYYYNNAILHVIIKKLNYDRNNSSNTASK